MSKSAKRLRFEEALQRLEQIVTAMESGEVGIEESIAQYEEATRLAQHCRQVLDQAEQRIKLIRLNAEGAPTLVDFDAAADGGTPAPARDDMTRNRESAGA